MIRKDLMPGTAGQPDRQLAGGQTHRQGLPPGPGSLAEWSAASPAPRSPSPEPAVPGRSRWQPYLDTGAPDGRNGRGRPACCRPPAACL